MKEAYRIVVESAGERTLIAGFETAHEAAEHLLAMLSEEGEEVESATIEKYFM